MCVCGCAKHSRVWIVEDLDWEKKGVPGRKIAFLSEHQSPSTRPKGQSLASLPVLVERMWHQQHQQQQSITAHWKFPPAFLSLDLSPKYYLIVYEPCTGPADKRVAKHPPAPIGCPLSSALTPSCWLRLWDRMGVFFFCSLALVVAVVVSSISEPSHFQWQVRVVWRFFFIWVWGASDEPAYCYEYPFGVCVFCVCSICHVANTGHNPKVRPYNPPSLAAGWLAGWLWFGVDLVRPSQY